MSLPLAHLARRFFGALVPVGPRRRDAAWTLEQLNGDEAELWARLGPADRRHAFGVARRVERALGHEATRPVLAAALLHDVGKLDSGLGPFGRAVATLRGRALDRSELRELQKGRGFDRRVALYLRHDELGAEMLELAGSDPLTVAWAREHHRPAEGWTVPARLGAALKAADDD